MSQVAKAAAAAAKGGNAQWNAQLLAEYMNQHRSQDVTVIDSPTGVSSKEFYHMTMKPRTDIHSSQQTNEIPHIQASVPSSQSMNELNPQDNLAM
jgi:hypothetical protein